MTGIIARLVSAAVLLAAGGHGALAVTVFVERSLFEAGASGALVTETFDAEIARAPVIVFDSGTTATTSTTGVPLTVNEVAFGRYAGFVKRDGFRDIIFEFPQPITAFGGDFSSLSSLMVTGSFDGTSMTLSIPDAIGGSEGFFGLIGDTAFSSISFSTDKGVFVFPEGPPVGGETFNLDDFTIAPIPLPAGLPLLLGALGMLGVIGALGRGASSRA